MTITFCVRCLGLGVTTCNLPVIPAYTGMTKENMICPRLFLNTGGSLLHGRQTEVKLGTVIDKTADRKLPTV